MSRWLWSCAATLLLPAAVGCGSNPEDAMSQGAAALPTSGTGATPAVAATGFVGTNAAPRQEASKSTSASAAAGTVAPTSSAAASGAAGAGMAVAGSGGGGAPHPASGAAAGGTATQPAANGGATGSAPTLTQIYEMIYSMKCAACHSMAPNDNQNGKLGMLRSKDQLYDALVNKPAQGSMCMGKGNYIVPGNPEMSLLIQKLSAKPACGVTMPLGSSLEPLLVKMLSDWIAAGALKN